MGECKGFKTRLCCVAGDPLRVYAKTTLTASCVLRIWLHLWQRRHSLRLLGLLLAIIAGSSSHRRGRHGERMR